MKKIIVLLCAACLMAGTVYGLFRMKIIPLGKLAKSAQVASATKTSAGKQATRPPASAPEPTPVAETPPETPYTPPTPTYTQPTQTAYANASGSSRTDASADERKRIERLTSVYEQMPPTDAAKILSKLPDPLVENILHTMDERQVGKILTTLPTERAARLTISLSR